ncbi:MAG TPA: amidohydrolase family protein [Burkholderiales bacterium]|nr:amidohydrolase family protein [Burkholderiales bacterium]
MNKPPPHAASAAAPLCAAYDPQPRRPRITFPPRSCDTHAHVCGPIATYPYAERRVYTPPDALLRAYRHMLDTLGVERAVLVQPSVYGTDNTVLLGAMRELGRERCRGVAVVEDDISDAELERLHAAGVRGVRVNVVDVAEDKGVIPMKTLAPLARRVKRFGWHVEFLMHADEFADMDAQFADFPADIVLGHLGYMKTDKGLAQAGFQAMLRLMRSGRCWVKLTGPYRISAQAMPHTDTIAFARALIEAAPERVLWGTDWPHVMVKGVMPNDGDLADLLLEWIPDEKVREQVLVRNPERLYGFS